MVLKLYPLDKQTCSLRMASCKLVLMFLEHTTLMYIRTQIRIMTRNTIYIYTFIFSDGWTTADLIFKWKQQDPVQVTSDLHLPRFALEQFTTDYCDSQTNTGKRRGIYKYFAFPGISLHISFESSFFSLKSICK